MIAAGSGYYLMLRDNCDRLQATVTSQQALIERQQTQIDTHDRERRRTMEMMQEMMQELWQQVVDLGKQMKGNRDSDTNMAKEHYGS